MDVRGDFLAAATSKHSLTIQLLDPVCTSGAEVAEGRREILESDGWLMGRVSLHQQASVQPCRWMVSSGTRDYSARGIYQARVLKAGRGGT